MSNTETAQAQEQALQIELFRQSVEYEKDGVKRKGYNFFVRCGNTLIPIDVKFFADKITKQDPQYSGRKAVLYAFAKELPPKDKQ